MEGKHLNKGLPYNFRLYYANHLKSFGNDYASYNHTPYYAYVIFECHKMNNKLMQFLKEVHQKRPQIGKF